MSESRTELLAWLNDLTQLGYTKVEQCGTGAVHCQIMDSIYRDVSMSKVKFNAKHEYEYIQNFKVLQNIFDKHKIEQAIPVERLAKCKMQDNLEFLQWMKKYWDQYYPGGVYDAIGRRKGEASGASSPSKIRSAGSLATAKKSTSSSSINSNPGAPAAVAKSARGAAGGAGAMPAARAAPARDPPVSSRNAAGANGSSLASMQSQWEKERSDLEAEYQSMVHEATQQALDLKLQVEQVEREREFYFGKLREIEILVQTHLDGGEAINTVQNLGEVLKHIQAIMYKTEEGFEIPATEVEEEENL